MTSEDLCFVPNVFLYEHKCQSVTHFAVRQRCTTVSCNSNVKSSVSDDDRKQGSAPFVPPKTHGKTKKRIHSKMFPIMQPDNESEKKSICTIYPPVRQILAVSAVSGVSEATPHRETGNRVQLRLTQSGDREAPV